MAAAERGDVEELKRLAQTMRGASGQPAGPAAESGGKRLEVPAVLSQPFPEACLAPAGALGLEHAEFAARVGGVSSGSARFSSTTPGSRRRRRTTGRATGVAELRHSFDAAGIDTASPRYGGDDLAVRAASLRQLGRYPLPPAAGRP